MDTVEFIVLVKTSYVCLEIVSISQNRQQTCVRNPGSTNPYEWVDCINKLDDQGLAAIEKLYSR